MARKVISLASGFVFLAGDAFLVFVFLFFAVVVRFAVDLFPLFADFFFAAIIMHYPPNPISCGILYYENPIYASSFTNKRFYIILCSLAKARLMPPTSCISPCTTASFPTRTVPRSFDSILVFIISSSSFFLSVSL